MELTKLQEVCEKMFELKVLKDNLDARKKEINVKLDAYKEIVMVELEKADMKSFKTKSMTLTRVDKRSVKILDHNLLLDWLESKDLLRHAIKVSAAAATSLYNDEFEKAQEAKDTDFLINGIAGLSDPAVYHTIQMRGKL